MSINANSLSDKEKYFFLRLSYIDIKNRPPLSDSNSQTIGEALNDAAKLMGISTEKREEIKNLINEYSELCKNNPKLEHTKIVGYENHNPVGNTTHDDKTGFVGYALEDEDGNRGFLLRGSELNKEDNLLVDMGDNAISTATGTSAQVKQAKKFFDDHKAQGKTNSLYGHSKGGNLVSEVFVDNLDDDIQAYVINGQPIYYDLTEKQKKALKSDKFTYIIQDGDFVSFLGFSFLYIDKIVKIDKDKAKGIFDPHYLSNAVFDSDGNLIIEQHPYAKYELQAIIAVIAAGLITSINAKSNAKIFFNVFYETTIIYIKAIVDGTTALANKIKNDFIAAMEVIDGIKNEFIDNLNKWFDEVKIAVFERLKSLSESIRAYIQAVTEPYLKVNTARLIYYAQRLSSVKRQIVDINRRLDSLYFKVDLFDLDNIFKADLLTEYNYILDQCINYLNNSAQTLESTENRLVRQANSI